MLVLQVAPGTSRRSCSTSLVGMSISLQDDVADGLRFEQLAHFSNPHLLIARCPAVPTDMMTYAGLCLADSQTFAFRRNRQLPRRSQIGASKPLGRCAPLLQELCPAKVDDRRDSPDCAWTCHEVPGEQRTSALAGLKGRKLFDVKGLIRFLRGGYCISLSTFPAASRRLPLPIRMEKDSARHSNVVSRKAMTKWR